MLKPNDDYAVPYSFTPKAILKGHTGLVTRLSWLPDGKRLASASHDYIIRIWDVERGIELKSFRGHRGNVNEVAITRGGKIVSASADETIKIWDLDSNKLINTLKGHTGGVNAIVLTPDGRRILSGSGDSTIKEWDIETGKELRTITGHTSFINYLAITHDGQLLVSASGFENYDNNIIIWDLKSGKQLKVFNAQTGPFYSVAVDPSGKMIASGSEDCTVRIWDLDSGLKKTLEGHTKRVISVSFSPNGELLASKSQDGTVRIWRCKDWEIMAALSEPFQSPIVFSGLAFNPSRPILATTIQEDIRIWELDLDILLDTAPISPSTNYVNSKVVLVGRSGVGKSALFSRLVYDEFKPQAATFGAQFARYKVPKELIEKRTLGNVEAELIIWDLAGNPEFYLVNELFLDDTNVALLLFDCTDLSKPLEEVYYWAEVFSRCAPQAIKYLVSSRCDVSPITIGDNDLNKTKKALKIKAHLLTSAKTTRDASSFVREF